MQTHEVFRGLALIFPSSSDKTRAKFSVPKRSILRYFGYVSAWPWDCFRKPRARGCAFEYFGIQLTENARRSPGSLSTRGRREIRYSQRVFVRLNTDIQRSDLADSSIDAITHHDHAVQARVYFFGDVLVKLESYAIDVFRPARPVNKTHLKIHDWFVGIFLREIFF